MGVMHYNGTFRTSHFTDRWLCYRCTGLCPENDFPELDEDEEEKDDSDDHLHIQSSDPLDKWQKKVTKQIMTPKAATPKTKEKADKMNKKVQKMMADKARQEQASKTETGNGENGPEETLRAAPSEVPERTYYLPRQDLKKGAEKAEKAKLEEASKTGTVNIEHGLEERHIDPAARAHETELLSR